MCGDMLKWPTTKNTRDGCPLDSRPQNYVAAYRHTADAVHRMLNFVQTSVKYNAEIEFNN